MKKINSAIAVCGLALCGCSATGATAEEVGLTDAQINSIASFFAAPIKSVATITPRYAAFGGATFTATDEVSSTDELAQPGFFSQVLFGNSHPGSCVNLLQGDADVAAFDDIDVDMYLAVPEGERDAVNQPGAVYGVAEGAAQPFDRVQGKEFGIIQSTPVLNGPIVYNADVLPEDIKDKILEGMTSAEVAENEQLFAPEDAEGTGAIWSLGDTAGFIAVDDEWYDPIRELA